LNGFQAVLRGLHLIVPSAKIQSDHTSKVCFIIDDENLCHGDLLRCLSSAPSAISFLKFEMYVRLRAES
jgi:hypothetical protein